MITGLASGLVVVHQSTLSLHHTRLGSAPHNLAPDKLANFPTFGPICPLYPPNFAHFLYKIAKVHPAYHCIVLNRIYSKTIAAISVVEI